MQSIFFEISKYIFIFMIAFYTAASYRAAVISDEAKRKHLHAVQITMLIGVHFLGFFILWLCNDLDSRYAILYVSELFYFLATILFYKLFYPKASRLLTHNMCFLMAVGFIMIARIDYDAALKQFFIAMLGTGATFLIPWIFKKVKSFRNFGLIYAALGLLLLILVLFSSRVFGANLVLELGPVSVQPGEFVKILFCLFIASMFNKDTSFRQVAKVTILAIAHVLILVVSKDLGTALILFVIYVMMIFCATHKLTYVFASLGAGSLASVLAYKIFSHVRQRVEIFLDPWSRIDGIGYQICQSLFAVGMGSWFGMGLNQGMPTAIPVAYKDFMFSCLAEEFGVIFVLALILICLNNLILIMNIASRCRTLFYRLVAVGLGSSYGFQVFLTIGGAMKMIPMTGVTLPFVSYGGSSLLSSICIVALVNGMYNMRHEEAASDVEKKKIKTEHKSKSAR